MNFRLSAISAVLILLQVFCTKAQNPCLQNQDVRVVILGSSTAAGAGSSTSDSSWVGRYRNSLQALNPNNEVINLAVGGFTTYRIMPHEFVSPIPNRPSVDSNRNITEAFSRNPDVIIVNLPSNDRQWPMAEQLGNFDSLWNMSWNAGIPMYIATTQPLGVSAGAAYQFSVRDSILSKYGDFAIEFFLPIADSNNMMHPAFNSGDNVHLNDNGHRVLWQQVMNKGILDSLVVVPAVPDFSADVLEIQFDPSCADSIIDFRFHFSNVGSSAPWSFDFKVQSADTSGTDTYFTISNMPSCSRDSFDFSLPVLNGGPMTVHTICSSIAATTSENDTARWDGSLSLRPFITGRSDTVCFGNDIAWSVPSNPGDTILWYYSNNGGVPIAGGGNLNLLSVKSDTTLYAESVIGPLTNLGQLATPYDVDRDWDGIMFDFVANSDLHLDSLAMRMEFALLYEVNMYTKMGSYKGSENSPGDWTLLAKDTAQSQANEALTVFNFPGINLLAGDTLGFYFYCEENNEDIVYTFAGGEEIFSDGNLQLITGTGISNTFGQTFFPRSINAVVFYHQGINYEGQCNSPRVSFSVSPEQLTVDLGTDISFTSQQDTFISAPSGFAGYQWLDCMTGNLISTSDSGVLITGRGPGDSLLLCLTVTSPNACQSSDTIKLKWSQYDGIEEFSSNESVILFPNPVSKKLNVSIVNGTQLDFIEVFDLSGRKLNCEFDFNGEYYQLDVESFPFGTYIVRTLSSEKTYQSKFVKF